MLWPTVVIAALAVGTLTNAVLYEVESGSSIAFIVETFPSTIQGCYLDTPKNTTLEFKPLDSSNDKYVLRDDTLFSQCSVTINDVNGDDNGIWRLHAVSESGLVYEVTHEVKVNGDDSEITNTTQSPEEITTTELPEDHTTTPPPSDDIITTTTEKEPIIEILDHIAFETVVGEQIKVNFTHTGFRETETCTVYTPDGKGYNVDNDLQLNGVQVVEDHTITCGLIITVENDFKGEWMLKTKEYVFGSDVDERWLPFNIGIKDEDKTTTASSLLTFKLNEAVNIEVGPEDAVYCKIYRSHSGEILHEGHDRCQIVVDRVTPELSGDWLIHYGLAGKVVMHYDVLHITVDSKPVVATEVKSVKPSVYLSCSVETAFEPKLCRFTDPSGESFISSPGATEEGYNFYGNGTTFDGDVYTHECGLEIISPSATDLGMWSCTIDTDEESYYSFLTVLCPWAMQDPAVAAQVVAEPVLTAETKQVTVSENEPVTMSCHVKSAIRYCYFRVHKNGTTYSVYPGISSDNYEYVGAGFDAGECGVRFTSLSSTDSGDWSCHVGFMDAEEPEQKAAIEVDIEPQIQVTQTLDDHSGQLELIGIVNKALDYCRFVRIDGYGFSSDSVPSEYSSFTSLSTGVCGLTIRNPSILERHEWTIAAKITGQIGEVSDNTSHSLHFNQQSTRYVGGLLVMYYILMFLGIFLVIFGLFMLKKEPRQWTMERANGIRNSFRKQPLEIINEKPVHNV